MPLVFGVQIVIRFDVIADEKKSTVDQGQLPLFFVVHLAKTRKNGGVKYSFPRVESLRI